MKIISYAKIDFRYVFSSLLRLLPLSPYLPRRQHARQAAPLFMPRAFGRLSRVCDFPAMSATRLLPLRHFFSDEPRYGSDADAIAAFLAAAY